MKHGFDAILRLLLLTGGIVALGVYLFGCERQLAARWAAKRRGRWRAGWRGVLRPWKEGWLRLRVSTGQPADDRRAAWVFTLTLLLFAVVPFAPPFSGGSSLQIVTGLHAETVLLWALLLLLMLARGLPSAAAESGILGMAFFSPVLFARSLQFDSVVEMQQLTGIWLCALQPVGCALWACYAVSAATRSPLPSATTASIDSQPGLAQFSETLQMLAHAYLGGMLYFGGWHFWGFPTNGTVAFWPVLLGGLALFAKAALIWLGLTWLRWTAGRGQPRIETEFVLWFGLSHVALMVALVGSVHDQAFLWPALLDWSLLAIGGLLVVRRRSRLKPGRRHEAPISLS